MDRPGTSAMKTLVSRGSLAAGILATCALVHAQSEEEIREEAIRVELESLRDSLNPGDDDRNAANLYQTALEEMIRTGDYGNEDWEEVWDAVWSAARRASPCSSASPRR